MAEGSSSNTIPGWVQYAAFFAAGGGVGGFGNQLVTTDQRVTQSQVKDVQSDVTDIKADLNALEELVRERTQDRFTRADGEKLEAKIEQIESAKVAAHREFSLRLQSLETASSALSLRIRELEGE